MRFSIDISSGLIFITIDRSLGVVSDEIFSVIVIMVILTTFLTPPVLSILLKRSQVLKILIFQVKYSVNERA